MKKLVDGIVYEIVEFGSATMERSLGAEYELSVAVEGQNLVVRALIFDEEAGDYIPDVSVESVTINGVARVMVEGVTSFPAVPGYYNISDKVGYTVDGPARNETELLKARIEQQDAMLREQNEQITWMLETLLAIQ